MTTTPSPPSFRFNPIDVERFNHSNAFNDDDDTCHAVRTISQRRVIKRSASSGKGARYADRRTTKAASSSQVRGTRGENLNQGLQGTTQKGVEVRGRQCGHHHYQGQEEDRHHHQQSTPAQFDTITTTMMLQRLPSDACSFAAEDALTRRPSNQRLRSRGNQTSARSTPRVISSFIDKLRRGDNGNTNSDQRQSSLLQKRRQARRLAIVQERSQIREERHSKRRRLALGLGSVKEMSWMATEEKDSATNGDDDDDDDDEAEESDGNDSARFADADDDSEASEDDERDLEVETLDRQLDVVSPSSTSFAAANSASPTTASAQPTAANSPALDTTPRTIKPLLFSRRMSPSAAAAATTVRQVSSPASMTRTHQETQAAPPKAPSQTSNRGVSRSRRTATQDASGSDSDSDIAAILQPRRVFTDDDVSMASLSATDTDSVTDVDDVDAWIADAVPPSPSPAPRAGAGGAVAWGRRIVSAGTSAAIGALASSMRAMPLMSRPDGGSGDVIMSRGPSSTGSDASMDLVVQTILSSSDEEALGGLRPATTLNDLRRRRLHELRHFAHFASKRSERDATNSRVFDRGVISFHALHVIWLAFLGRGRSPSISQRGVVTQVFIPPRLSLDVQRQLARRHTRLIQRFNAIEIARGVTDEALWEILATWTQPGSLRQQLALEAAEREHQQANMLEVQYRQYMEHEAARQRHTEHARAMALQQHLRDQATRADLARQDQLQAHARYAARELRTSELWEQEARQQEQREQQAVVSQLLPAVDIVEMAANASLFGSPLPSPTLSLTHQSETFTSSTLDDDDDDDDNNESGRPPQPPAWSPPRTGHPRNSIMARISSALPSLSRVPFISPTQTLRRTSSGDNNNNESATETRSQLGPNEEQADDLAPPPTPSAWSSTFRLPSISLLSTPRRAASAPAAVVPATPPRLPEYATIEYNHRSPPPPPPYNAMAGFEILEEARIEDDLFAVDDESDDEEAFEGSARTGRLPGGLEQDETEEAAGNGGRCIIM